MLPKNLPAGTRVVCMKDYSSEMNPEEYEPDSIPRLGGVYEISEKKCIDIGTFSHPIYGYFLTGGVTDIFWWNAVDFVLLTDFEPDD